MSSSIWICSFGVVGSSDITCDGNRSQELPRFLEVRSKRDFSSIGWPEEWPPLIPTGDRISRHAFAQPTRRALYAPVKAQNVVGDLVKTADTQLAPILLMFQATERHQPGS